VKAILVLLEDNVDADKVAALFHKQGAIEVRVGEFTREKVVAHEGEQFIATKRFNWPATRVR
jgi:hypothetical protein